MCFDKIVVESKALAALTDLHRAQLQNYLKTTGYKLGFLVNFGQYPRLEYERIVKEHFLFFHPFFVFFRVFRGLYFVLGGETMSIKEQVLQRLDTLSEAELVEVSAFMAFLKFRARLPHTSALTEAQLATLYAACTEEDRTLAEEGMTEYAHELCQEDAS